MPRKAFREDLAQAVTACQFGGISQVTPGEDDSFSFQYWLAVANVNVTITALVPDTSEYPSNHEYVIFADEDAPSSVASAVGSVSSVRGEPIAAFLHSLSAHLDGRINIGTTPNGLASDGDLIMSDSQLEGEDSVSESDNQNQDWDMDDDDEDESQRRRAALGLNDELHTSHMSRVRSDLGAVKAAGFKVGHLGSLGSGDSCYISVAIRAHKLAISEEALQAWNLTPDNYIILILYYFSGYQPLDVVLAQSSITARQTVQMAVAVSDTYKPRTTAEALSMFQTQPCDNTAQAAPADQSSGLCEAFISRPLNALLNGRLFSIIRARLARDIGWCQAEKWFDDHQGNTVHSNSYKSTEEDESAVFHESSGLTMSDEIKTPKSQNERSLPLIAMQFFLRHFVRCTDFCLVCHCKLESRLQDAIKPYVCERPLCLYQFMSLGFGPSIEHEILNSGWTVDLLLSFAYAAAASYRLKGYPEGLSLTVPDVTLPMRGWTPPAEDPIPLVAKSKSKSAAPKVETPSGAPLSEPHQKSIIHAASFDQAKHSLLFDPRTVCPVRVGDFIVVTPVKETALPTAHFRVIDTSFFPTVQLSSKPLYPQVALKDGTRPSKKVTAVTQSGLSDVLFIIYDQNFDKLDKKSRCQTIVLLLSLMPTIREMRDFLVSRPGATLARWTDRLSPAQIGLLHWVVASNRACIMQVDQPKDHTGKVGEERVRGIEQYLQFRFAMGAPDKEARFNTAVKSGGNELHPTLFAWHGSHLGNWHAIIRQGLNFKSIANGRAFGDGVYLAKAFTTSMGYCGTATEHMIWPPSELGIQSAVALNEVVNAPSQFVQQEPHWVVQELDWIQTRVLFVKPYDHVAIQKDTELLVRLAQDPARTPMGSDLKAIVLPITIVPRSRRRVETAAAGKTETSVLTTASVNAHNAQLGGNDIAVKDYDIVSIMTDAEDREILLDSDILSAGPPLLRATTITEPLLPFSPGDLQGIPLLPPPPYATAIATRRLQKDFRALSKLQDEHKEANALHDLGWWLDEDHLTTTNNLYQWIVELHSFQASLPLAMDLEKRGLKSVVLEIRFHAAYPICPPFVRVVRPRFRTFAAGGGGHVTAGGSICMDLLTNSGWSPATSLDNVLLQIRMAITSTDPWPARLDALISRVPTADEYVVGEAVDAFKRACRAHGWAIPEGLNDVTRF